MAKRIISFAAIHVDETTPHPGIVIFAADRGEFHRRKTIGDKKKMRRTQERNF